MLKRYVPTLFAFSCIAIAQGPTAKPKIVTEADLPRLTFPVQGTPQQLLELPTSEFLAFAEPVLAAIDKLSAQYEVDDHATLRLMLNTRLAVDILRGDRDTEALALVQQVRSLEDKPATKLIGGLNDEVYLRARMAASGKVADGCPAGYAAMYRSALQPLPWATIAPEVQEQRLRSQVSTRQFYLGMADSRVGPTLAQQHALGLSDAEHMIVVRASLQAEVPCAAATADVLKAFVQQNKVAKPDIWSAREMTLPPAGQLTPVNVAIWDSGIDLPLFPGRLFTNPQPGPEEDPHGIAFDVHARPTHGNLIPLTPEVQAKYPTLVQQIEGEGDLQNGVDSPAATRLRSQMASMSPAQMRTFFDQLEVVGGYSHGTHVTGIAARGNPAIRLAYARFTYDENNPHLPPTEEDQQNLAAMYRTEVAWFRAHGIRVVNMSWWNRPSNYEKDLADNGIGKDDAERKEIARRFFTIERDALFHALQSAPEILFVTIAGNNDANNAFEECIPSSFVLPNLIVTGAVDQAGDETSFTSYGANVAVHADGYAVPSVVPGGATVRESGTSMAAPQVTNLAAKLLAVNSALTPPEVIALIREGATNSDDGRRHLIDPAQSLRLLQQRRTQTQSSTH